MSILALVLVNLAESDDESPYVTLARQPVEALIEDWLHRGELISSLCELLTVVQKEHTLPGGIEKPDRPCSMLPNPLEEKALRAPDSTVPEVTALTAQQHAVRRKIAALITEALQAIGR